MIRLGSKISSGIVNSQRLTWIMELTLDTGVRRWSSLPVSIGGNEYGGDYTIFDSMQPIDQNIDIAMGGNLVAVGNTSLSLNEIATTSGVHTEFKPHADGTELINRRMRIGVTHDDGTSMSASDILWLFDGVVDDYESTRQSIPLQLIDAREIDMIELPRFTVDDTTYENAPAEMMSAPIPIVYGKGIAPLYCVDNIVQVYAAACHPIALLGSVKYRETQMPDYWNLVVQTGYAYGAPVVGSVTPNVNDTTYDASGFATMTIPAGCVCAKKQYINFSRAGSQNSSAYWMEFIRKSPETPIPIEANAWLVLICDTLPTGTIFGPVTFNGQHYGGANTFALGYKGDDTAVNNLIHAFNIQTGSWHVASSAWDGKSTSEFAKTEIYAVNGNAPFTFGLGDYTFDMVVTVGQQSIVTPAVATSAPARANRTRTRTGSMR